MRLLIAGGAGAHKDLYGDFEKDDYYNIRVFKKIETAL